MPRAKNAKADKAFTLYRQGWKLSEIAAKLGVPAGTVRRWKHDNGWDNERSKPNAETNANVRKGPGAPPGNKNAVGHAGSTPAGNQRATRLGMFSRYMPQDTLDILGVTEETTPIEMLWDQIQVAYAAIIRAQKMLGDVGCEDYAAYLNSQARAQAELRNLIKQYDEMVHHDWMLATEEQKARIAVLRARAQNGAPDEEIADDGFLSALEGMAAEDWSDGDEAG